MNALDFGGALGAAISGAVKKAKAYTDTVVQSIGAGYTPKGEVNTVADLPASGNELGDEYLIKDGSGSYAWGGTTWSPNTRKGETGATGATGPTGPQGANGRVYDVKFNGISVLDESNMAIIIVNPNQTATPTTAKLTKLQIGNVNYMLQGGGSSVYNDISALVTDFNSKASGDLETGWNLYIRTRNVPDLWVSKNDEETSVPYTYVSDAQFVADLSAATGGLQIGYYRVDQLETEKVTVPVQDARINNVSAVVGGVFNVPKASDSAFGVVKTWQGTQAQYDAIANKDADTYYFITD